MEDKIFDIVTDLLREDISKSEAIERLLGLHSVSITDKAQMITALTYTMHVNKKELGEYHSLRDNSLLELNKLIQSID